MCFENVRAGVCVYHFFGTNMPTSISHVFLPLNLKNQYKFNKFFLEKCASAGARAKTGAH